MSKLETKDLYLSSLQTLLYKLADTYHLYDDKENVLFIPKLHSNVGIYPISDFIIYYNKGGEPIRIIESAFKEDYNLAQWLTLIYHTKKSAAILPYNFGFKVACELKLTRADYTSAREEWLECLGLKHQYS